MVRLFQASLGQNACIKHCVSDVVHTVSGVRSTRYSHSCHTYLHLNPLVLHSSIRLVDPLQCTSVVLKVLIHRVIVVLQFPCVDECLFPAGLEVVKLTNQLLPVVPDSLHNRVGQAWVVLGETPVLGHKGLDGWTSSHDLIPQGLQEQVVNEVAGITDPQTSLMKPLFLVRVLEGQMSFEHKWCHAGVFNY